MKPSLSRRLAAEVAGTAALIVAVVGSGIMAQRLTDDAALALLCNAIATGAALVVLIAALGPVSGAHFNPAVTLVAALKRELPAREAVLLLLGQVAGGAGGTLLAHTMFELPLIGWSQQARTGGGQWLAEAVATFGLVALIRIGGHSQNASMPWLVGLYITAAYWFTASTSFANPAVTLARTLTDTFSGIRPADAPAFILAQCTGALLAMLASGWLLRERDA
ncbi:MAG TPA: MIP/aquaporin family protein [Devosia sp.]|nr:MIP/aquaporin family protein [Devosia sp.]